MKVTWCRNDSSNPNRFQPIHLSKSCFDMNSKESSTAVSVHVKTVDKNTTIRYPKKTCCSLKTRLKMTGKTSKGQLRYFTLFCLTLWRLENVGITILCELGMCHHRISLNTSEFLLSLDLVLFLCFAPLIISILHFASLCNSTLFHLCVILYHFFLI